MILIVDFGGQTCHLIGRRLRDHSVEIKIIDPENALAEIKANKPKGIILSGGPGSVYEENAKSIDKKVFEQNIPVLGICYGVQLMAHLLGGKVVGSQKEYGPANLDILNEGIILNGVENNSVAWVSHGDTVVTLPPGFIHLAQTDRAKYSAVADLKRKIFGVQFHPEVDHTVFGNEILKNFAEKVCGLKLSKQEIDVEGLIKNIKQQVGEQKVICAVSGGVDSTVAAVLIGKAIGKNLYPVYIESGLMRIGTDKEVDSIFRKHVGIVPIIVEAKKEFLAALKGLKDPEAKRKAIGKLYVELFDREAKKLKGATFLAQGTIYSDVIESKGTKNADKIKSHHNVGGLPDDMNLTLLEPLRNFYKDEVRLIGEKLGLPKDVVYKQVFPGPGQAIRIIGEVTEERLDGQHSTEFFVTFNI